MEFLILWWRSCNLCGSWFMVRLDSNQPPFSRVGKDEMGYKVQIYRGHTSSLESNHIFQFGITNRRDSIQDWVTAVMLNQTSNCCTDEKDIWDYAMQGFDKKKRLLMFVSGRRRRNRKRRKTHGCKRWFEIVYWNKIQSLQNPKHISSLCPALPHFPLREAFLWEKR